MVFYKARDGNDDRVMFEKKRVMGCQIQMKGDFWYEILRKKISGY